MNNLSNQLKQLQNLQCDVHTVDFLYTNIIKIKIENQLKEIKIQEQQQSINKLKSYLEILQKYPEKYKEIIKLSVNI